FDEVGRRGRLVDMMQGEIAVQLFHLAGKQRLEHEKFRFHDCVMFQLCISCARRVCWLLASGQAAGGRVGPQSFPISCRAAFTPVTLVPFSSSARMFSNSSMPRMSCMAWA